MEMEYVRTEAVSYTHLAKTTAETEEAKKTAWFTSIWKPGAGA